MADELDLKADRVSSFGGAGYEDEDYTSVLTEAEVMYVKLFRDGKNNRKGESLDETEVRNQGLSALIKRSAQLAVSSSQANVLANGQFFDLPNDFMYTIHEDVTIDKVKCDTDDTNIEVDVIPVGHDEISRLKKNKYKRPYFETYGEGKIWRLSYSREIDGDVPTAPATTKRHQLVTDGTFNVDTYLMSYLRLPKGIVVDRDVTGNQRNSILDESTHPVIVDIALSLLLERVKEQELSNISPLRDIE
jgi:hypothetical protein